MMCFKDKAFCGSDCVNTECHRHFGKDENDAARAWWGHDPERAPVAFSDFSDGCDGYKPSKEG